MEVSIIIPCLNEAQTLRACIQKANDCFDRHRINGEIIVVDNGSSDQSTEVALTAGARVVTEDNRGYGNALKKGFEEARGQFIVMGDADDSYNFSDTYRFVEKLRAGYDVVLGSRLKGEIKAGAMPWLHRYFGNPVFTFILNLLYGANISDVHCGMRGFRRDVLAKMDLRTEGMELASEMVIKSILSGLRLAEIPITLYRDGRNRPSHLRTFRDGLRHLGVILKLLPHAAFLSLKVFFQPQS